MEQKASLVEEHDKCLGPAAYKAFYAKHRITSDHIRQWANDFKGQDDEPSYEELKVRVSSTPVRPVPAQPPKATASLGTGLNNLLTINRTLHKTLDDISNVISDIQFKLGPNSMVRKAKAK